MKTFFTNINEKLIVIKIAAVFMVVMLTGSGMAYAYVGEAASAAGFEGNVIRAIETRGLKRIEEEEMLDLMGLEKGNKLHLSDIQRGLRRAFKKGIFLDIKVDADAFRDGVRLVYDVSEVPLVRKVKIKSSGVLSERGLKKAVKIEKGVNFFEKMLPAVKSRLLNYCVRKGYPEADVRIEYILDAESATVDLLIYLDEGMPALIKKIVTIPEVRRVMRLVEYSKLDLDRLRDDMDRVREYFVGKGFVAVKIGPYSFSDGILEVPVEKGPHLSVSFEGNDSVKTSTLNKALPFERDGRIDDDTIAEAVDAVRSVYLSRGFYNAHVAAAVEHNEKEIKVSFFIQEGVRVNIGRISFPGVSIPPEAIKRVMSLKEGVPYNDSLVDDDIEAILALYNALGFLSARVVEVRRLPSGNGDRMNIIFSIDEGVRTTVNSVEITGNTIASNDLLVKLLGISAGSPLNLVDVSDARQRLLRYYKNRGYARASIDISQEKVGDSVRLIFHITEGKLHRIGKIIIKGNNLTRPKIIRRELTFDDGDLYDESMLLESRRRLYRLGIFNEVMINKIDTGVVKDGESITDILISLRESRPGAVEISLGFGDYERFRGMLDISYRNLGGYNREIGFKTELSSVEKRFVLRFREPWLFNIDNLPLNVYLLKEEKRSINIDTRELLYEIDKFGLLAEVKRKMSRHVTVGLDYEYSFTDTKNVEEGVILSREDQGTVGISSISPGIYIDTRDDPFDPSRGSFNSVVVKMASSIIFSEVNFIKTTFKSAWFYPLHRKLVLALSLRGGVAFSLDDTEQLPLIERYFLGGRTTVRGYDQDTLGPKGKDGHPTGGNVFSLLNAELRYSLPKGFGFGAFVDGGNVWETLDEINQDLRYTAGVGIRYRTPVGPVRIDYGQKIGKKRGESAGEVHFSFGHAF
jgi:outer membrane protein insertion porin family